MQTKSFQEWCAELDTLAKAAGEPHPSYTEQTGTECWKDAYEDGLSPQDAWAEEVSAAADCIG